MFRPNGLCYSVSVRTDLAGETDVSAGDEAGGDYERMDNTPLTIPRWHGGRDANPVRSCGEDTGWAGVVLAIRNIAHLYLPVRDAKPVSLRTRPEVIPDAFVLVDGEAVVAFGPDATFSPTMDGGGLAVDTLDAQGGCVLPGLIDGHTHLVFAGSRENEFVQRIEGKSYAQIAEEGGGIRRTVRAVREQSMDDLVESARPRLRAALACGVTTLEIKSGYGLTVDDEIKMLEAVQRLAKLQPIELVGTFLGAHTFPAEFAHSRSAYVDLVCSEEMMGRVAQARLAEFCDVFCERTAFAVDESRRILQAGLRRGLRPKLHADQLSQMGASRLAAEVGAISADHLEHIDAGGIEALKKGGVIPVLLPGCSFFLGVPQAPARELILADLPVALATDCNPGSCMIASLPLVMSIACTQMRLTPGQALLAATSNAAAALGRQDRVGRIGVGLQADLLLLDVPTVDRWMYHVGRDCVRAVVKRGRVVYQRRD